MPKKTEAELLAQRNEMVKAVLEASEDDLMYLDAALQARNLDRGFITPSEQFVTRILYRYQCRCLSVELIQKDLEEFEDDIGLHERAMENYAKQFPEKFKAKREELNSAAE